MAAELSDDDGAPPAGRGLTSTAPRPPGADPVDQLSAILSAVTDLAGTCWHELNGHRVHEALGVLEQLDRRLSAVRSEVLSTIESNRLWELEGQRTFNAWLRQRTDTTAGAASRQIRHARALRDLLPLTRAALEAGSISTEHVAVLVREALLTEHLRAQLSDADMGEAFLVTNAQEMDAATFTKLVKTWAIAADPERQRWNQRSVTAGELSRHYGFTDVDGSRPDAWAYLAAAEQDPSADPNHHR